MDFQDIDAITVLTDACKDCGTSFFRIVQYRPNLYFTLCLACEEGEAEDRSSRAEAVGSGGHVKTNVVSKAGREADLIAAARPPTKTSESSGDNYRPERRRPYMKEYMRKRRAAAKASKP